jgi:hypothetical protein
MDHMVTYSPPSFPKLPQHPTRTKSTTTRQPNLDVFTIRSTKPTIKANPKENENPDYKELFNWSTTTKTSNTPREFPSDNDQGNNFDDEKKVNGNNEEYSDNENENEYDENNSEQYDELPEEDFAESDEDVDDDIMKRRKRFHSQRERQTFGRHTNKKLSVKN